MGGSCLRSGRVSASSVKDWRLFERALSVGAGRLWPSMLSSDASWIPLRLRLAREGRCHSLLQA